jgi:hypothetical protein
MNINSLIPSTLNHAVVPEGYTVSEDGVFEGNVLLSATPVIPLARARNFASDRWMTMIGHRNLDGTWKVHQIPFADLSRPTEALRELADGGLLIGPGQYNAFSAFLTHCSADPTLPAVRLVQRLGLFSIPSDGGDEILSFMLPSGCMTPASVSAGDETEPVLFRPRMLVPAYQAFAPSGTLDAWKSHIESLKGSTALVLGAVAGLAAPFLNLAGIDNFGINFYGDSSTGKTLALQGFASVWGRASDPQYCGGRPTAIERWNATANGLEVMAAVYDGMGMAIDELGANTDAGVSVYNLFSGRGKLRMTETGSARGQNTWSLLIASSGEVAMAERIQEIEMRKAKTGELIRLLDIAVGALPPRDNLTSDERRRRAEALKPALGECYGVAGPAFARAVLDASVTVSALREAFATQNDEYHAAIMTHVQEKGFTLTPATRRALRRFAFLLTVGFWAIEADVLPLNDAELSTAIEDVVEAWLAEMPRESEEETVLDRVRDYVRRNRAQIVNVDAPIGQPLRNNVGWKGIVYRGLLLLTEASLREACGDLAVSRAAKLLRAQKILKTETPDKLTYRVTISSLGINRGRFYALDHQRVVGGGEVAEPEAVPSI